jgi:hypothetical protein
MSRRRRLSPPWLPGFWPMVAFLLLIGSVAGYFYCLAKLTTFEKAPPEPPIKTAAK